jgi:hypothetical protein
LVLTRARESIAVPHLTAYLSPDGQWLWEGHSWLPVSPDQRWVWDGDRWRSPAPAGPPLPWRPFVTAQPVAYAVLVYLTAFVIVDGGDVLNSILDLGVYAGLFGPPLGDGLHRQARNVAIGLLWLLVAFPGSVLAIAFWVHAAYRNLQTLAHQARTSSGMAVAWFFIPFANLVMPYSIMKEIWSGSQVGEASAANTTRLRLWWGCWVLGIVVGIIQAVVSLRADADVPMRIAAATLSLPSDLLQSVAAVVLVQIVLRATRGQDRMASRGTAG